MVVTSLGVMHNKKGHPLFPVENLWVSYSFPILSIAEGGTHDHVAISLRQAGKPCLLAGEQYQTLTTHHGQQATLACARFNGTPQAFIVEGDFS